MVWRTARRSFREAVAMFPDTVWRGISNEDNHLRRIRPPFHIQGCSQRSSNLQIHFKLERVDSGVSTRDQTPNSDDERSYRFRTVTTTTGEESS